ncbi:unnamed protein product [Brachionus calyciflorus]|uniref:UDP-N-acetylglucosamine 2-epimerase (non-hydrolyzing) n=1 Tax=Brachionus calyciflorus TaxID=104777 RepID=A0A814C8Y4_9BILA|nr:unnamed protein product [Brachionus calyciflorus]
MKNLRFKSFNNILIVITFFVCLSILFYLKNSNLIEIKNFKLNSKNENNFLLPKVVIVIGTRPEAVKCAPLISELRKLNYGNKFELVVLSTGQHREILRQTLNSFGQKVDIDLDLMTTNQDLSTFFNSAFQKLTLEFKRLNKVSLVVVQGDTTTALAAALAASYLHISVAHVEAGLRSYDMENPFPEETNRKLIDAVSRLMFAPTEYSKQALVKEGVCPSDIFVTGNTGIDAFYSLQSKNLSHLPSIIKDIQNFKENKNNLKAVILVTMHRRENFDNMKEMCLAIKEIVNKHKENVLVIFPVHPNPNVRKIVNEILKNGDNIRIIEPISYDIFPRVLTESDIILTDSGGIQEESSSIGKPVILMRETTERPEGIYVGTIQQIGVKLDKIVDSVENAINSLRSKNNQNLKLHLFGDGQASRRIGRILEDYFSQKLERNQSCLTKPRQDLLAREVYKLNLTDLNNFNQEKTHLKGTSYFNLNYEPYDLRKSKLIERSKARDRLKMNEIFSLSSKYNISRKDDDEFSITAVVSLYKRTGLAKRWVESLINQTHPPKIIWIVYFASPVANQLDTEVAEVKSLLNQTNTSLFVNKGEMQLKYFGRFQLALQTKTKYVVVFDDDCIPQSRFLESCLYTINTEAYNGILGTKGTPFAENYFYGPVSGSDTITEVDVVGGSWFMEREWVKLMFRDKMFTWQTGEDWQLCVNARVYGNVRSFVMPVNKDDPRTNAVTSDYIAISNRGDTNGQVQSYRHNLRMSQNERGDRHMDSYLRKQKTILIFAEEMKSAEILLNVFHNYVNLSIDVALAVPNKNGFNLDELKRIHEFKFFNDFMIGRNFDSKMTNISTVILMGSLAGPTSIAVATAAQLINYPVLNFLSHEDIKDQIYSDIIRNLATVNIYFNFKTLDPNEIDKFQEAIQKIF